VDKTPRTGEGPLAATSLSPTVKVEPQDHLDGSAHNEKNASDLTCAEKDGFLPYRLLGIQLDHFLLFGEC